MINAHIQSSKSKFIATTIINGKPVSFFTPPHGEPDFLWVDVEELAKAFLPRAAARKMLKLSQKSNAAGRISATAQNGSSIVTIVCHAVAQSLCGAIDQINGHPEKKADDWGGGPAETAYSVAAGHMMADHFPLPFEMLFKAFHNQGGPLLRGVRETEAQ